MSLLESITGRGDAPFMIREGRTRSYAELRAAIEQCRELLRKEGIGSGAVVAITGNYGFEATTWFLALAANRNVVVPLTGTDPKEVEARMTEAGAEFEVRGKGERGEEGERSTFNVQRSTFRVEREEGEGLTCEDGREVRKSNFAIRSLLRERAGLVLFSSGSTGRAKGMIHDLDTLMRSYRIGPTRGLRVLAFMGLDHIGGIDIFLRGIASGSCLVVPGERTPEAVCRLIEEARVEVLPATPSFLNLMLLSGAHRDRDLSSLKIVGFGAERMPAAVLGRLKEALPGVDFQQKFGTSETNAVRTVNKVGDPLWIRIDDPKVESKIVDGELWLKTPSRILGYINHESDQLTADGWYRTGDWVEEDGEGFFRVVGRRESMINVGGEKVIPGEVEGVIGELEDVRDCRVFGEANPILGQVVAAEFVIAQGADEREMVRAVKKYCRQRLPVFKVPVKVRVVKEIEMTGRFKRKI